MTEDSDALGTAPDFRGISHPFIERSQSSVNNMIRRTPELDAMELRWQASQPSHGPRYWRKIEAMYDFARESGALTNRDPLDGLEEKIRFIRRRQCLGADRSARQGA